LRCSLLVALLCSPGCLMSHRSVAIPTAFDDLPHAHVATDEVKGCTVEVFGFIPVSKARGGKHHHDADVVNALEAKGPHQGIIVESIQRHWGLAYSRCSYASGRPVEPGEVQ
jgi:hypothetical protein